MPLAYTKDFLVSAYLSRYTKVCDKDRLENLKKMAESHYDKVGKDKFRQHASLDAAAIKEYKELMRC